MIAPVLRSDKFAEDLYLLLMCSPLRGRVDALGRKHGLDHAAFKFEVMRYAETFMRWADERPCSQIVRSVEPSYLLSIGSGPQVPRKVPNVAGQGTRRPAPKSARARLMSVAATGPLAT